MNGGKKLQNWKVLETETLFSAPPWLTVRAERVELPDGREVEDFYQIDVMPFVCIFAEAEDGEILVIRQYKHGARQVSLTFPGGTIDAGEAPLAAAKRELREETGHEAESWLALGDFVVNANQGCGRAHLFIARGCRRVCAPDSGDLEEMDVTTMPRGEILAAAGRGEFRLLNQLALFSLATHPDLLAALGEAAE
jgi:ADP-ribose pyrophosphatase